MSHRTANPAIPRLLVDRWSPRSFDGRPLAQSDLDLMFEAAALAPSAFNYQPWTFLYAHRDTPDWERFLALLIPFNQSWAAQASALVFIISDTLIRNGKGNAASHSHSFDCGAAWGQLALQATALGYHCHAMTGVDFDRAADELAIPGHYRLEVAIAIGRKASADLLPEGLRERELPSGRKALHEFTKAGAFSR